MLPDQGLYEERYRLTGSVVMSLALSLGMLAVAWRLDRERLTALTAAVAPGIQVVNADLAAQGPAMEGPAIDGAAIDGAAIEGQDLG